MERLVLIWNGLGRWFDANYDKPMFQYFFGMAIGVALVCGILLIVKGLLHKDDDEDMQKEENDGNVH